MNHGGEINETENRKPVEEIKETESCCFEKIKETDDLLF